MNEVFGILFSTFACQLCKEWLTQQLAKGFFWSILLLLGMPLFLMSLITWGIVRSTRRRA